MKLYIVLLFFVGVVMAGSNETTILLNKLESLPDLSSKLEGGRTLDYLKNEIKHPSRVKVIFRHQVPLPGSDKMIPAATYHFINPNHKIGFLFWKKSSNLVIHEPRFSLIKMGKEKFLQSEIEFIKSL